MTISLGPIALGVEQRRQVAHGRCASARRQRPPAWRGRRCRARPPRASADRWRRRRPRASPIAEPPHSAASAISASRLVAPVTIGAATVPAIRPPAMSSRLATTRSKPSSAPIRSANTVNPPETSAVRTPAAREVATSARAPGISRMRAGGLVEHRRGQALQHEDALGERGGEIEFAVHRPPGDLGDMGAQPDEIRQLVEHLVLDDRRFEIGDEHPLAAAGGRLDQRHRSRRRRSPRGRQLRPLCRAMPRERADRRPCPAASQSGAPASGNAAASAATRSGRGHRGPGPAITVITRFD